MHHVFRYWMGRNETINDAPILQDAHKAYKNSGGSLKALLVSILTSDAFLYRKVRYPKTLSKKISLQLLRIEVLSYVWFLVGDVYYTYTHHM